VAHPRVLRTSATFLLLVDAAAFIMVLDGTLSRREGAVLLALFLAYVVFSFVQERRARAAGEAAAVRDASAGDGELEEIEKKLASRSTRAITLLLIGGLVGVLIGSEFLVLGAVGIAEAMGLSKVVIGLTVVAIGTSVPEIATVVTSALKGHSSLGVGNIIGADILNICWVAGISAMAQPLTATRREILLMFPAMLVIVITMLAMLFLGRYRLRRAHGAVLVAMYVAFTVLLFLSAGG
jgi:cation:H+ antiporter